MPSSVRVLGLEPGGVVGIKVSKYNWVWEGSDRRKIRDVVSRGFRGRGDVDVY